MKRSMVTLKKPLNDSIIEQLREENMYVIFSSKLTPELIGVEGESLEKLKTFSFVEDARDEYIGRIDAKY